jgi:hypothetical protein
MEELAKVMVSVAFVPPTCFGKNNGSAAVNMLAGGLGMGDTAQYHFAWSFPGAPDAASIFGIPGDVTYGLTVSDFQGCSSTYTFTVNQPPAILLGVDSTNIRCFGGSDGIAAITGVSNANLPVSYLWNNNAVLPQISNLPAGNYTVTITDAEFCTSTKTF